MELSVFKKMIKEIEESDLISGKLLLKMVWHMKIMNHS